MLALGPVTSTAGTTYTAAQIQALLFGPSLTMRWVFDLLDPGFRYKDDLTPLVDTASPPAISYDSSRAVPRELTISLQRPSTTADVLQDLIRVRYLLTTPDGGEVEWEIGTFMLVQPSRSIAALGTAWSMSCPDLSQLLNDAAFDRAASTRLGESHASAIARLVSSYGGPVPLSTFVPDRGTLIDAPLSWDPGTSFLKAVADLSAAINYTPPYMSGARLASRDYPDFNAVVPSLELDTVAGQAKIFGPLAETVDFSNAYNQFKVVSEDSRRAAFSFRYDNTRPDSPVSLRNWHPRLKYISDSKLIDEAACKARALTEAQTAARVYADTSFSMVPFPFFESLDVVTLTYQAADEGTVRSPHLITKYTHACVAKPNSTAVTSQRVVAA